VIYWKSSGVAEPVDPVPERRRRFWSVLLDCSDLLEVTRGGGASGSGARKKKAV
jgi:hypothetical protein